MTADTNRETEATEAVSAVSVAAAAAAPIAAAAEGAEVVVAGQVSPLPFAEAAKAAPDRHAPECPLRRDKSALTAENTLYIVAERGWRDPEARLVLDAISLCDYCRTRFRAFQQEQRSEQWAAVRLLADGLGERRQQRDYEAARRSGGLWLTEKIEAELTRAAAARGLDPDPDLWSGFFHAFVGLAREACDVLEPDQPFLLLSAGPLPLPEAWQESDALEYLNGELEMDDRTLRAGLRELKALLLRSAGAGQAVEPLGWFVPVVPASGGNRSAALLRGSDLCLLGWPDLLEPRTADVGRLSFSGTPSLTAGGAEEISVTDAYSSLSEEYASALARIRQQAELP